MCTTRRALGFGMPLSARILSVVLSLGSMPTGLHELCERVPWTWTLRTSLTGDNNLVGSGGVILSGGQKQRVVGTPWMDTLWDEASGDRPWFELRIRTGSWCCWTMSLAGWTTKLQTSSSSNCSVPGNSLTNLGRLSS